MVFLKPIIFVPLIVGATSEATGSRVTVFYATGCACMVGVFVRFSFTVATIR